MLVDAEGRRCVFAERRGCEAVGHDEDDCDDDGDDPRIVLAFVDGGEGPLYTATLCMVLVSNAMNGLEIAEATAPSIMPMMGTGQRNAGETRRSSAKYHPCPRTPEGDRAGHARELGLPGHAIMTAGPVRPFGRARRGGLSLKRFWVTSCMTGQHGHGGTRRIRAMVRERARRERSASRRPGKGSSTHRWTGTEPAGQDGQRGQCECQGRLDDEVVVQASPRRMRVSGRRRGGGGNAS